jgi:hypothetical protein
VTMANAPLLGDETARLIVLICPTEQEEFFPRGDWTGQITLKEFGELAFWRRGIGAGLMDGWVFHEAEGSLISVSSPFHFPICLI